MEKISLRELLKETYSGKVVLPDFQRSFVWSPEDVRQLLTSVFGRYFIGSMLFLESTKEEAPFALRLVEGVEEVNPEARIPYSVKIILDGQQRTTALFYAFYSPEVSLRNRKYPHKFYIDIKKVLAGDYENGIIGISTADKKQLREIRNNKYVLSLEEFKDLKGLVKRFNNDPEVPLEDLVELHNDIMEKYTIHVVYLSEDTSLDKIVETFERLNKTGMPLSIFDLATARLYKYGINLRNLLEEAKTQYTFLDAIPPESILKVIALIREKEPKRKNLLELGHDNFKKEWERACIALELAYRRITDVRNGYGVLDFKKWTPYSTLVVPMAALIDYIKRNNLEDKTSYSKIDAFYWSSVFMTRYDQAVDSKSFSDFKDMINWIENSETPEFIEKFDVEDIDFEVSNRGSAIFKAVINLIVLKGALDFKTGQPPQFELNPSKIQIDHIFPKSLYQEDCILNRTIITTNQSKSNKPPSKYFEELINQLGENTVKEILESHLIPAEALESLLNDNIKEFMELRKKAILEEIRRKIMV